MDKYNSELELTYNLLLTGILGAVCHICLAIVCEVVLYIVYDVYVDFESLNTNSLIALVMLKCYSDDVPVYIKLV